MSGSKISENIEEYLEVLYRNGSNGEQVSTTQLSNDLNIAPGSVTQMLKKLEKLGYIIYTPYKGASLTDDGLKIAQKITRKHRILEKFLLDILKVKEENIHNQACEMEHSLSDEAERAICTMLHHPDLCPDNKVIPACNFDFNSCQECFSVKDFDDVVNRKFNLLSISELTSDTEGVISFIRGNKELLDEISEMGIGVGLNINFEYLNNTKTSSYIVLIDDEEFNLSSEMANNIFIKI